MWYVVQQQPGETIALSNHQDYDSAKFKLMNTQRYDSKNFYEILSSEELGIDPNYVLWLTQTLFTLFITIDMQSLNVKSSAVTQLNVDELEGIAQVEFTNGNKYTYFDVAKDAIRELLYDAKPDTSIGSWVNTNLVNAERRYDFGFTS